MATQNDSGAQAAAGAQRKRVFSAEYPFKCEKCHQQHPKGTRALFIEKDGKRFVAAADCYWPNRAATKSSDAVATGEEKGVKTSPSLPEDLSVASFLTQRQAEEYGIAARLDFATRLVQERYKADITSISKYADLIAELCHEQYGQLQTARIQSNKSGNIEKVQRGR